MRKCKAPDCERDAFVRGVCGMHNHRLLSHGTYDKPHHPSPLERLMRKVVKDELGCWIHTGCKTAGNSKKPTDRGGYAWFWLDGKNVMAHRASYELHVGPIPEGYEIDHLCGNRACVKPQHLEPVTPVENCRRRDLRRRLLTVNGA